MKHSQQGVGLIEVIVALVILAIAVLGFSAMQMRAVSTGIEASNNVHATNIARDLAERLRINRQGLSDLQKSGFRTTNADCGTTACTPAQMAQYDFGQVQARATNLAMQIAVLNCQGSTLARSCVYVSWGDTNPTNGTDNNPDGGMDCTNGRTYNTNAQCVIMEIYNRD